MCKGLIEKLKHMPKIFRWTELKWRTAAAFSLQMTVLVVFSSKWMQDINLYLFLQIHVWLVVYEAILELKGSFYIVETHHRPFTYIGERPMRSSRVSGIHACHSGKTSWPFSYNLTLKMSDRFFVCTWFISDNNGEFWLFYILFRHDTVRSRCHHIRPPFGIPAKLMDSLCLPPWVSIVQI